MFFHALTFAGFLGSCLNTRPIGKAIKHLSRDPESVNATKQTYVIIILAYFTLFQPNSHRKRCLKIKLSVFLHWISLNKMTLVVSFRTS